MYKPQNRTGALCHAVLTLLLVFAATVPAYATTNDTTVYGAAANPTGNPVGGGAGYTQVFTTGDYVVTTAEELSAALSKAQAGQVVYVATDASIDLTGKAGLIIRSGVTLAGNRGYLGSAGPLLYCDEFNTNGLFNMLGAGARITGLRLQGPDGEVGPSAYFRPNSTAISVSGNQVQVDNNEIYNWSYGGVSVVSGAQNVHVHHNYIHHVQRNGLGYPVVVNTGSALIEANIFDYYRHAIAGTGYIGCAYEARYNLVRSHATSHAFDMHGGADFCPKRGAGRCTEEEQYMAGEYVVIHHNTFEVTSQRAILLRGVPLQRTEVHDNWFYHPTIEQGFGFSNFSGGNTAVYHNVYGPEQRLVETVWQPELFIRKGSVAGSGAVVAMAGRYKNVRFKLSNPSDTVTTMAHGNLPVVVELDTAGALHIVQVEYLVDDIAIFTGPTLPAPNQVVVDTTKLADGAHRFTVRLTDADSTVLTQTTTFRTVNHWTINDEMQPPVKSAWFGDLISFATSNDAAGWEYVQGDHAQFFGDDNRRVRTSTQAEALIWQTPRLQEYAVTLYLRQPRVEHGIAVAVLADDATWSALPFAVHCNGQASPDGWYAVEITGTVQENEHVKAFSLAVADTLPVEQVQVGRVKLTGWETWE